MRDYPTLDVASDLRKAAKAPLALGRPAMAALLSRAADEIELLRLALSDAMTRDNIGLPKELGSKPRD